MLIDSVKITVRAGNGGRGVATFSRNAQTAKGGPDGGNGGNGGNIYIQGSYNVRDLHQFQYTKKVEADPGEAGRKSNQFGRNAEHKTILVPVGTLVQDEKTGKTYEITDDTRQLLIARGGAGGRGNYEFRSATNQTPTISEPGGEGQEKHLLLDLRLIAEIGLIGLPNAGKSSLLSVLTNATPIIGSYPFTTLVPNIGMLGNHPIADIPGLIEGASTGKGLGLKFLKHIEKTKILVHCIDVTIDDPVATYETVRSEFQQYNPLLLEKPEIILLNKTDLVTEEKVHSIKKLFTPNHTLVIACSIYDDTSIENLKKILLKTLSE